MERRTADVIGQKVFAVAQWVPMDVMASYYGQHLTEEAAEDFLERNEKYIVEAMIAAGFEAIDACLIQERG